MPTSRGWISLAGLLAQTLAVLAQQDCPSSYSLCQPSGATSTSLPKTGPELAPLYNDLLAAVKDVAPASEKLESDVSLGSRSHRRDTPSTCCNQALTCLNLDGFNIPMCYDRFTTNYRLADGSIGNIADASFVGNDTGSANLQDGVFTDAEHSTGNMYAGGGAASYSPTNSAAVPTPYTAAGVGSAIPVGELGGYATFVITVPGTTDPGTTFTGETAPSTVPGTTRVGTTVAAHTSVVTTFISVAATPSSSSSQAAAASLPEPTGPMVCLLGVVAIAAIF